VVWRKTNTSDWQFMYLCIKFIVLFSFFTRTQLIELKRNPEGTIEKRSRPTVKPQLSKAGGSGSGSTGGHRSAGHHRRENSLHHKNKARNAKLRKELRNLDDEIQVMCMCHLRCVTSSSRDLYGKTVSTRQSVKRVFSLNETFICDAFDGCWWGKGGNSFFYLVPDWAAYSIRATFFYADEMKVWNGSACKMRRFSCSVTTSLSRWPTA